MTPITANVLQPLIDVAEEVLLFFHDNAGFGWGASIIALTVVVRAALIPLTLKQFKSMQAMQRLAPEIKALQQKYKEDKQRLNQEMMKFYQQNKINPLGSCLPLIAQLPVFMALFFMLQKDLKHDICPGVLKLPTSKISDTACNTVDPGSGQFLFIPDITAQATGWVLVVLILLYVGSQLASSLLMSVTADRNQRMLMLGLPVVFVIFIINFPAGLIVYWITTNIWTIAQQYIVRRTVGPLKPAVATADAGSSSQKGGTKGSPPPPPRQRKKRSGRRK